MQLELDASVLENVQKVVVRAQALAVIMDAVEAKYKARIEEMEKRDPTEQLKASTKEITRQIAHRIADTTHLLETAIELWLGIEQIDAVEQVHKEILQAKAEIAMLKEETPSLTPVQWMVQSCKSKKM